jgi:hypothetical protein|tara:strand:- start:1494 stop:1733 length:240 start_codon:yes stop_codon:yes gene_type:complete
MKKIIIFSLSVLFMSITSQALANPMGEKVTKVSMKTMKKAGQECEDKGGVMLDILPWKTVAHYAVCVNKDVLIQLTLDQ